jgi:Putative zinc ribbon domain
MTVQHCESCGMSMATAEDHAPGHPDSAYCRYCSTEDGGLQPFEERFERMTQWAMRQDGLDRPAAEVKTRQYMRSMPAWRDHPALREA